MNGITRQLLHGEAKRQERRLAWRMNLFRILQFLGITFIILSVSVWFYARAQEPNTGEVIHSPSLRPPETLKELLVLLPAELEHCDIARMNLLCAEGLPGAEHLGVNRDLAVLDQWAQHIQSETARNFHHYQDNPAHFYNSTNFYKMLIMAVVLYEDHGVRYDPKRIESPEAARSDDHFFADSRDIFIHGLVGSSRIGTCSSMPVLYVALARRLGYPVKLVSTRGHLFMRWDSPTERFGMDATGKGLNEYTDEHYRQWPFAVSDEEIRAEGYLKSMTAAEELSVFLSIRGQCLQEAGKLKGAITAYAAALKFAPNWRGNRISLANAERQYAKKSSAELVMVQPKFPSRKAETDDQQSQLASQLGRTESGIREAPIAQASASSDPTPTAK